VYKKREWKVVALGDNVRLPCHISGTPTPMMRWTKGDEVITDYTWERFRSDKKSLSIDNVELDDTGIYICKGTNGFGSSDEARTDLIVIGITTLTNTPKMTTFFLSRHQLI
jgi:hypothetical protein